MRKLGWMGAALCGLGAAFAACSAAGTNNTFTSSGGSAGHGGETPTSSTSSTTATGTGGEGFTISTGTNTGGSGNTGGACAGETTKAEQIPLDLYLMLDSSGSMGDSTGNIFNPLETKWDAIKLALGAFFVDPKSAGVGVGIQHFPMADPAVPASCTSSAACQAANGSSCLLKTCIVSSGGSYQIAPCETDADCAQYGSNACVPLGSCGPLTAAHDNLCIPPTPKDPSLPDFCTSGTCTALGTSFCSAEDSCDAGDYATAAVPISVLPANGSPLGAQINAWTPDGATPTSAALTGAIEHARTWALANPTHAVVVVLATDGMPTECDPQDIATIAQIAAQGVSGTPSIKTFAIGVFTLPDIFAGAQTNLDQIAAAGGTGTAFVVNTAQNVTAQFQAALDKIRMSKLACEFKVPEPGDAGALDYDKVNVKHTPQGGAPKTVGYVGKAQNCDPTKGGWYYDVEPSPTTTPTKIVMCKATCDAFGTGGQVDIEVGCETYHQPPPQ